MILHGKCCIQVAICMELLGTWHCTLKKKGPRIYNHSLHQASESRWSRQTGSAKYASIRLGFHLSNVLLSCWMLFLDLGQVTKIKYSISPIAGSHLRAILVAFEAGSLEVIPCEVFGHRESWRRTIVQVVLGRSKGKRKLSWWSRKP